MTDPIRPDFSVSAPPFLGEAYEELNREFIVEKTFSAALEALATFGSFIKSVARLFVDERSIIVDIAARQGNILTVLFFVKVVGVTDSELYLIINHATQEGHTHILESLVSHKDCLRESQIYALLNTATQTLEGRSTMPILIDSYLDGDFSPSNNPDDLAILKLLCTRRGVGTLVKLLSLYNIDLESSCSGLEESYDERPFSVREVLNAELARSRVASLPIGQFRGPA